MKNKVRKVLYISNIKVPYRVRFLNELAKEYDLTVLYERKKSLNRNENWASSEAINYHVDYLGGKPFKNEYGLSTRILSIVLKGWDAIIIGCYNSPSQILAMQLMRMRHIPYIINLDGEQFIGNGLKDKIKRVILHGASGYLVAGEKSGETLANALDLSEDLAKVKITPYYFSSLSEQEIEVHSKERCIRNNKVLVIGQYFDYKGMDVAYEVAKRTPYISYKFIGMGNRTSLFLKERTGGGIS